MDGSIEFFSEEIDFQLENQVQINNWLSVVAKSENKTLGELSFIFCTDEYLHNINVQYLNHDTYTDIITFDYSEGNILAGDIFISIQRVQENAKSFNVDFFDELCRVLVHGVLHLMGYKDKSIEEQQTMRAKEDFYLTLFS